MILFLSFCTLTAILVVVCVKLRVGEPDVVSKLHTLLRREKCYTCTCLSSTCMLYYTIVIVDVRPMQLLHTYPCYQTVIACSYLHAVYHVATAVCCFCMLYNIFVYIIY